MTNDPSVSGPKLYRIASYPQLGVLIFLSVLFLFFPVVSLIGICAYGLRMKQGSVSLVIVMLAMISILLGLVNITKLPESDLIVYLNWFDAAREQTYWSTLQINPKEPLYYSYLHVIANLPASSEGLFVFLSTAITYGLFLAVIARLCLFFELPNYVIFGVIVFFAFFPPLFNNSAHLLRQFMAGAIIAWFYLACILQWRWRWWLLFLAVITHTTTILFVPLAVLGEVRRVKPGTLLFLVALGLAGLFLFVVILGPYLVSLPYLGPIIQRAISGVYTEHAKLDFAPVMFLLVIITISIYQLFQGYQHSLTEHKTAPNSLYITTTFLSLFILIAHVTGENMLATRYILYVYFLAAHLLIMVLVGLKQKKLFSGLAITIMPVYFIYVLNNGTWEYALEMIWTSAILSN